MLANPQLNTYMLSKHMSVQPISWFSEFILSSFFLQLCFMYWKYLLKFKET